MPDDIFEDNKGSAPLTENDILAAISDDLVSDEDETEVETKTEPEADKEDKDKEEKSEETEEEAEIKLDEEPNDDLEYIEVPNRASILKEFPGIFKKFPGIERAIYREDQYSKVFGSIQEAKDARETIDNFSKVQTDLLDGNIGNLLATVKTTSPEAFGKITGTLLQTLAKVDRDAYFGITENVTKHLLTTAFTHGKEQGDEDGQQLQLAAQILNKFLYGKTQIEGPKVVNTEVKTDPEKIKLQTERQQFEKTKLDSAVNEVTSRINNLTRKAVEKYIDPKNLMGDFVKSKAMDDVLRALDKEITTDHRFRQQLDRLWSESRNASYSAESKEKIVDAIKRKAQSILPGHIKAVRARAIKGSQRRTETNPRKLKEDENDDDEPVNRQLARPAKKSSNSENNGRPRIGNTVNDVMKFLSE